MFDETGCGGDGGHTFCCPGDAKQPICGWWGHNNGACPNYSTCPDDMTEIGSMQIHCNGEGNYQTACCTTDVDAMKLYGTCEWGQYPNCNDQEGCPNPLGNKNMRTPKVASVSGSGGGKCKPLKNTVGLPVSSNQFRKFCCDTREENLRFGDCKPYRDRGPGPDPEPSGFCRSGCPPDRVQVAIDTEIDTCSTVGVGGMAHCCKTDYSEVFEWENPKLDAFKYQLKAWMKKPTCPDEKEILLRRGTLVDNIGANASLSMDLASRAVKEIDNSNDMTVLLARVIAGTLAQPLLEEMADIWSGELREEYPYIVYRYLAALRKQTPEWETDDPEIMSRYLVCNPKKANARSAAIQGLKSDGGKIIFNCSISCDASGNCGNELPKALRNEYEVTVKDADGNEATLEYEIPPHDPPSDLDPTNPNLQHAVTFENDDDCFDASIIQIEYHVELPYFQTEHPLDKSVLKKFLSDLTNGILRNGATSQFGPIPIHFLEEVNRLGIEQGGWPAIPGNPEFDNDNLWSRLFEVLGSRDNVDNFVITDEEINAIKGVLMQLFNPYQLTTIETRLASNPDEVFARVRAVISFFEYMNLSQDESGFNANPKGKLGNIINQIVRQLLHAEALYEEEHGERVLIAQFFREWYTAYCEKVTEKAQEWLRKTLRIIKDFYENRTGDRAREGRTFALHFIPLVNRLRIETDWSIPLLEDDDEDVEMGDTK
ncbi:hypothetical protein FLAG1_11670 [Fusarium langsethiae]|uniref:Uncharacterized protein n=1 Tax=Fusarium langsethiae TaxID=179993 RepID=A0A0M9EMC7_FUSLA|nr:hypothetical protein FLAG1_11670 [Fusarium langsethiae]GKU12195.1 unnamed protein product [Fusarium langsethiae]